MGTKAYIGIMTKEGDTIGSVLNWDGDPQSVGPVLLEHYNTREAIDQLLEYGEIAELAPTIDDCVFYARDKKEYLWKYAPMDACDWVSWRYVWDTSTQIWYVKGNDGELIRLADFRDKQLSS